MPWPWNTTFDKLAVIVADGQPCDHPGCLIHISHPCEGCGRIGGKGDVTENPFIEDKTYGK